MEFFELLAAALPKDLPLETLKAYAPEMLWQTMPEMAAIYALARCGRFDCADYLQRNPDVASQNIDPIQHFVKHGINEKRAFQCLPKMD